MLGDQDGLQPLSLLLVRVKCIQRFKESTTPGHELVIILIFRVFEYIGDPRFLHDEYVVLYARSNPATDCIGGQQAREAIPIADRNLGV